MKPDPTRAVVTIAEMARMVKLSRSRFYQLVQAGVFPRPCRDLQSGRPFYSQELQRTCLEVRRRNLGLNGKPVFFYARRKSHKRRTTSQAQHTDLIEALKGLGLASVKPAQVAKALKDLFPHGTGQVDHAEVVKTVFLYLRSQQTAGGA
jgi:hypothetical protein